MIALVDKGDIQAINNTYNKSRNYVYLGDVECCGKTKN